MHGMIHSTKLVDLLKTELADAIALALAPVQNRSDPLGVHAILVISV